MKLRFTLLILCLCSAPFMAAAQNTRVQEVNTFVTNAEALTVRRDSSESLKRVADRFVWTEQNSLITNAEALTVRSFPKDSVEVIRESADKYFRLLFLKLKKGKENNFYKPIVPKDKERYELFDKGTSYVSVVLGFGETRTTNMFIEPIVKMDNVFSTKVDLELGGAYFVGKNIALGGRIGYALSDSRINMNSDIFELLFNTKDMSMNGVTTDFSAGFFVKNFIPLDRDKRVFIVNETRLGYTYSYTLSRNEYNEGTLVRKAEQRRNRIGVGITPGLMYFLTRHLSLEFLISPVLAFYEHTSVTNNEIENGELKGGGINFIVTPIKMNFGISYFFGLKEKTR